MPATGTAGRALNHSSLSLSTTTLVASKLATAASTSTPKIARQSQTAMIPDPAKGASMGETELKGGELTAEGRYAGGFHWSANYVFTDVEDSVDAGYDAATRYAAFASTTPEHRANLNIGWSNDQWSVDTFTRYEGDKALYYNAALQPVDGHMTFAGRVARELPYGMTLALSGQNLLDDAQRQTSGLAAERRVFMTLSKDW